LKVPRTFQRGKCPRCKTALGGDDAKTPQTTSFSPWLFAGLAGAGALLIMVGLIGIGLRVKNAKLANDVEVAAVDPAPRNNEPAFEPRGDIQEPVNEQTNRRQPEPDDLFDETDDVPRIPEIKLTGRSPGYNEPATIEAIKPAPITPEPSHSEPIKPAPVNLIPPVQAAKAPAKPVMEPIRKQETLRTDQAQFLGVLADGKRFCIIADCSQSMSGNAIEELKMETTKTLRGLDPSREFYVIFFHSLSIPMPSPTWLAASKKNVENVVPWVNNIRAQGGTLPSASFVQAFNLRPRPDVIFFMTDGLIPPFVPAQVAQLNSAKPKVVIHTIMFTRDVNAHGFGKMKLDPANANMVMATLRTRGEAPLRLIAEQSGGTFRHVTGK
jgi:hypothetical protein